MGEFLDVFEKTGAFSPIFSSENSHKCPENARYTMWRKPAAPKLFDEDLHVQLLHSRDDPGRTRCSNLILGRRLSLVLGLSRKNFIGVGGSVGVRR